MAKYRIVLELDTLQSYRVAHRAAIEAELAMYDYLLASREMDTEDLKSNNNEGLARESVGIISVEQID